MMGICMNDYVYMTELGCSTGARGVSLLSTKISPRFSRLHEELFQTITPSNPLQNTPKFPSPSLVSPGSITANTTASHHPP